MYSAAEVLVIDEGKCSITLIQRKLKVGYGMAARIVDDLERSGIVGRYPERMVLITRDKDAP